MELRVSGRAGDDYEQRDGPLQTKHLVFAASAELRELAEFVEERFGMTEPSPWMLRVVDPAKKKRAGVLLKRVVACGEHGGCGTLSVEKADNLRDLLKRVKDRDTGKEARIGCLETILKLKREGGVIPEAEEDSIERELAMCMPFERIASRHPELQGETYLKNTKLGCLLAPEDEPSLFQSGGNPRQFVRSRAYVELDWCASFDTPFRVEVVARVPQGWPRPYHLTRYDGSCSVDTTDHYFDDMYGGDGFWDL